MYIFVSLCPYNIYIASPQNLGLTAAEWGARPSGCSDAGRFLFQGPVKCKPSLRKILRPWKGGVLASMILIIESTQRQQRKGWQRQGNTSFSMNAAFLYRKLWKGFQCSWKRSFKNYNWQFTTSLCISNGKRAAKQTQKKNKMRAKGAKQYDGRKTVFTLVKFPCLVLPFRIQNAKLVYCLWNFAFT